MAKHSTFVMMSQPASQTCAVLGGILATRMKVRGVKGIAVGGRIRDITEMKKLHFPVWAAATSTIGTGMESKAWAVDVAVTIQGIVVRPGDFVFSDPIEGLVVIPEDKLDAVLELVPKLVKADERVQEDVENGVSVKEAFTKHRNKI
ncbi:MAG: hypothetical protein M1828_002498 [Chrysothrix sp. TS-e1954]|nr:MAG: hypothetical protein M1828_002498 [Chrysothrix sp. TS-e1954]